MIVHDASVTIFMMDDALVFEVVDGPRKGGWFGKWQGAVRPTMFPWTLEPVDAT